MSFHTHYSSRRLWRLLLLDESGMYKKSQPRMQMVRTDSHLCNRNCLQFVQDIDSHHTTKERAFITYHTSDSHFAEQKSNYHASKGNPTSLHINGSYLLEVKALLKLNNLNIWGLDSVLQVIPQIGADSQRKDVLNALGKRNSCSCL